MEAAYQAQMRALDVVWTLQGGGREGTLQAAGVAASAPAAQAPPPPPRARPRVRSFDELDDEVRANFWRLPESFTRGDVCKLLDFEPDRGALYRSLEAMREEGFLRVEAKGSGRKATVYRKTSSDSSPS